MAGHSQFANIKHRKAGRDAKRSKLFTKLTREIQVAAATGQPDPDFNPRLRAALAVARKAGVPKDRIEMAIKKASGELVGENYEEVRYEGYGPGGIAFIVEALSDNRNRTASDVRTCFTKYGGALGETGCVNFMFDKIGLLEFKADVAKPEDIFEVAAEAGAEDVESDDNFHTVICQPDAFGKVREQLTQKYGDPETAKLTWKPKDTIELDKEAAETILKLVDALEDSDDVQDVTGNFVVPQEIVDALDG
jgi:YebC/PmpR family DNA-binding regulatory protein